MQESATMPRDSTTLLRESTTLLSESATLLRESSTLLRERAPLLRETATLVSERSLRGTSGVAPMEVVKLVERNPANQHCLRFFSATRCFASSL